MRNCDLKLVLEKINIDLDTIEIKNFRLRRRKEKDYIQSIIKADFEEIDNDVFRKLKTDLKDHNISEEEIRKKMDELTEKAKSDFK